MSAREIIAKKLKDMGVHHVDIGAGLLLSGLTAAGYRILGPDDIDPVTVERCARTGQACAESEAYDLQDIRDGYIEAITTGKHGGRSIKPEHAKEFARKFGERSDTVFMAAENVAAAIRRLSEEEAGK